MEILIAVLGSGVLSTLITQIFTLVNNKRVEKSGVIESQRLLMKCQLRDLCVKYIAQGWIYADELEDIISMHECYHNKLGGNGFLDELMKDVKNLPIRGIGA